MSDFKDLLSAELVFENVDSCVVDAQYIKLLLINDVKQGIHSFAAKRKEKSIGMRYYNYCEYFSITISKDADYTPFLDFGNLPFEKMNENGKRVEAGLFARLLLGDICAVHLHYGDHTEEISVPWDQEHEYSNHYQITELKDNGDIEIEIVNRDARQDG